MQNEKEKLLHFLQNSGKINAIKAEEIGNYFDEKEIAKNEFF
jgi:hypothetical protein